jgi:hypothetical protein
MTKLRCGWAAIWCELDDGHEGDHQSGDFAWREGDLRSDLRVAEIKIEERSLELALLQANLHEIRGQNDRDHEVSVLYPYSCKCGWTGRVFPADEVPWV